LFQIVSTGGFGPLFDYYLEVADRPQLENLTDLIQMASINAKTTKPVILEAYKASQADLTTAQVELRVALVWAILATLWALAF
jgi:hypothetical protein